MMHDTTRLFGIPRRGEASEGAWDSPPADPVLPDAELLPVGQAPEDRLREIRRKVKTGEYRVASDLIALCLLRSHLPADGSAELH